MRRIDDRRSRNGRSGPECGTRASGLLLALAGAVLALPPSVATPDAAKRDSAEIRPGTGRLEGRVTISRQLVPARARFDPYPPRYRHDPRAGAVDPLGDLRNEIKNVVIYLQAPALGPRGTTGRRHVIEQMGEAFVPQVLPILQGDTVEFPNRDPFYHNVFSLSKAQSFDLGRYPTNASKSVEFDQAGIVKIFCHIHADMSAVILVLDNPYFGVPAEDRRYSIEGIPPGEYEVVAWHQRARRIERRVRIDSARAVSLDFDIPVRDDPDAP